MGNKSFLSNKAVLVLLFVVAMNLVAVVLLWQLDVFLNSEPYHHGLVFSHDWADAYWYNNQMVWAFVAGAAALAACAVIPHYLHNKRQSGFTQLFGSLLPSIALVYQGLGIFFLSEVDFVVKYTLYGHGLAVSFDWTVTYEPLITALYALMIISLVVLVYPTIRLLGLVQVKME